MLQRCRAALQQRTADLRRHHCAPTLHCSCQRLALPPLRCSCQRALPLTCEENTALRGCAAAANALCYRRCAAAGNALRCRAALLLPCEVTTALCRCAAAATLPLPTHCATELRCRCPARSPLRSSAALQLPTPCAAAAALPVNDRSTITTRTRITSAAEPRRCSVLPPLFLEQSKEERKRLFHIITILEMRWKVPKDFPGGKTKPRCAYPCRSHRSVELTCEKFPSHREYMC